MHKSECVQCGWVIGSKVPQVLTHAYDIHRHTHKGQMVNMPQYQ